MISHDQSWLQNLMGYYASCPYMNPETFWGVALRETVKMFSSILIVPVNIKKTADVLDLKVK